MGIKVGTQSKRGYSEVGKMYVIQWDQTKNLGYTTTEWFGVDQAEPCRKKKIIVNLKRKEKLHIMSGVIRVEQVFDKMTLGIINEQR